MKRLFQIDPFIEMLNCRQLRMTGDYQFIEASENHCKFYYEGYLVRIQAKQVHIHVLKDEELLVHVDHLIDFEMKRQENENETVR